MDSILSIKSEKVQKAFEIVAKMKFKNDPECLSKALEEAMELWLESNTGGVKILEKYRD